MKYEVIHAVCETGNFTKAAKKLNYSQSAVSQAVRNFEKELGITLFERSKKGVRPLEEVRPIIESIQKIYEEERLMKEEGLKKTENELISIGKPLVIDEENLFQKIQELYVEAYNETEKMKDLVHELVPTYKIDKAH